MNLYKIELKTLKKKRLLDIIVHANSPDDAVSHLARRFRGADILSCICLPGCAKHFVLAELEEDPET